MSFLQFEIDFFLHFFCLFFASKKKDKKKKNLKFLNVFEKQYFPSRSFFCPFSFFKKKKAVFLIQPLFRKRSGLLRKSFFFALQQRVKTKKEKSRFQKNRKNFLKSFSIFHLFIFLYPFFELRQKKQLF